MFVSSISEGEVPWAKPVPALFTMAYSLDVPRDCKREAAADWTEVGLLTSYDCVVHALELKGLHEKQHRVCELTILSNSTLSPASFFTSCTAFSPFATSRDPRYT